MDLSVKVLYFVFTTPNMYQCKWIPSNVCHIYNY